MAEVNEIVVSRTVRVNTGNYEGTEFFVSHKAVIDEFDSPEEETARLQKQVDTAMVLQLGASYRVRGKAITASALAKLHGIPYDPPKSDG